MRIIGGRLKGRRLGSLKGADLRPTLDRVRESLFNQLAPDIEDAGFLDLFAGTGAVGIEALSRGAREVVFVENQPTAQTLIYKNLTTCGLFPDDKDSDAKNWILLKNPALTALSILADRGHAFDLVHVDPPFADDVYAETLTALGKSGLLKPAAQVVVEHFHKKALQESYGRLKQFKSRQLGDTCLTFYALDS